MRWTGIFALALVAVTGWTTAAAWRRHADEAAVRAVVQKYFDGMLEGSPEKLGAAFDHDAVLLGVGHHGIVRLPFEAWSAELDEPFDDPEAYHSRIAAVDIAGDAAMVKTDLEWPSYHYVDYLSLLKIDGAWRIVNKAWHQEPSRRLLARIHETPVDSAALERYAGRYRMGGTELEVWVEDGRLGLARPGTSPTILYPVGGAAFAPSFDPDGRVVFREAGGRVSGFELTYEDEDVVVDRVD